MQKRDKTDIWMYEEDGTFLGFATTINGENAILVDYLAVSENARGKGVGSKILQDLRHHYGEDRLFLEIETVDENAPNRHERQRRKEFYLKNEMQEMGVKVNIFNTDMELLSYGYRMSFEEYRSFYEVNYSKFAANHIYPPKGTLADPNKKRKKL